MFGFGKKDYQVEFVYDNAELEIPTWVSAASEEDALEQGMARIGEVLPEGTQGTWSVTEEPRRRFLGLF